LGSRGVSSLIIPLFATGVVYSGGKFAFNNTSGTGGKFAAGVVDTGGKFAACIVDTDLPPV